MQAMPQLPKQSEETSQHVAQCPKTGRSSAFEQSTQDVAQWLASNNTHPDIQQLLLQNLCGQGLISCLDCTLDLNLCVCVFASGYGGVPVKHTITIASDPPC
jgi:hypothetical protein